MTSGGDQIFPRGLPVGTVDEVVDDASNPPYVDILIKPAANLGHLEELLVLTQVSDQMAPREQRDLAQSAAAGELAATQQRASDILAERLPGLDDPTALADSSQLMHALENPDTATVKLHPPPPLHADHFSPDATQPARALTPGQAVVDQKYAPTAESTAPAVAEAPKAKAKASGESGAPAVATPKVLKAKPAGPPADVPAVPAAPDASSGTTPQ